MLRAKLVIVGGDAKAGEVKLQQLPITIGRGKEAGLTIPHALVSRAHSELFERDGRLFVRDLGSLNGTFVNNTRIEAEQAIEPNQLLTLGNITFRAVYQIDKSAQATLLATSLPDALSSTASEPITTDLSDSIPTLAADNNGATEEADTNTGTKSDPAPAFEETKTPSSAISEIDSFDPEEVGSLGITSEKINPSVIASQVRSPEKPKKPSSMKTIVTPSQPTLRTPPTSPIKKPAMKKPPTPSVDMNAQQTTDAPNDIGLANVAGEAPIKPIDSADIDLGIAEEQTDLVSFVGTIETDDDNKPPSQIDDFELDLGDEEEAENNVDASRLGSFLKNLPK